VLRGGSWRAGLAGAAVLLAGLAIGLAGGVFVDQAYPDYVPPVFLPQGRAEVDTVTYQQAVRIIQARYYDRRVSSARLSQGGVRGLVQALNDPFSEYLNPDQYRRQQDSYAGRHTGVIGIYVNFENDYPLVSGVIPDSPAQKAGLRTDDVILKIDGRDAKGIKSEEATALIRGPDGSTVTLTIRRGGQVQDVRVTRANFTSPLVVSTQLEGSILYVRVYQFGDKTSQQLDQALKAGLPGARGVVLDLRNNPGGYIAAAADVISRFVSSGEAFELRDRNGKVDRTDVTGDHPAASIPLFVLVNGYSASASEIVAGSLQAHGRARLVGTKTYGKGSVQLDFPLRDGGDLHLTIQHWFLPNGKSVDRGVGLKPDEVVDLPQRDAMFDVAQPARGHAGDTQLNRALELLGARSAGVAA
jgi:carboxyl-terminal processing protease